MQVCMVAIPECTYKAESLIPLSSSQGKMADGQQEGGREWGWREEN